VGRGPQRRLVRAIRRGPQRRDASHDAHDVRLIAATCVDLERAVADELFDAELFDRLSAQRIALPALRQRPADVPVLVEHFARIEARELGVDQPPFAPRALDKLCAYSWPGNVSELRSAVRRLLVRARRGSIDVADVEAVLPPVIERVPAEQLSFEEMVRAKIHALLVRMEGYPLEDLYEEVISRVERPLIELVLERTNNNQVRAAEILGMNRNTLRKKIAERKLAQKTDKQR
jgi:two-component system, NtrC family, nitrogen regulation response regulator GlnG